MSHSLRVAEALDAAVMRVVSVPAPLLIVRKMCPSGNIHTLP
jgi:hypothetical protein